MIFLFLLKNIDCGTTTVLTSTHNLGFEISEPEFYGDLIYRFRIRILEVELAMSTCLCLL